MYVEDLKTDFYEFLTGKRIFLMVHYDIDSICTCKILQSLLKYNHILYTLAVIRNIEDLKTAYRENCSDVKYFVLINCGGTIDIVEEVEAEDDVIFFILDSHRPTDLCNIYSNGQVRLLSSPEDDSQVPDFHDIFREESEDEEETEDEEGENQAAKRRRLDEAEIIKRRERRHWEENRNRLLFDYTQFTYYARASAIYMFELAWRLNKDDKDLLWLAIVALTEQMLFGKIEDTLYTLEVGTLQTHVTRLRNRAHGTDVITSLKITFENDLKLALYRHWTLESSLKYSVFTAVRMRLWSRNGNTTLHALLADMGIPLSECQQPYRTMDVRLKKELHGALEKVSNRYRLDDIIYASFTLQYGYGNVFCASDFVYAMLAILEASPCHKQPSELFNSALDCLSRTKKEVIDLGIDRAKAILIILFKTIQSVIGSKHIKCSGPFVYYIIQEGCLDWYMFSQPHILSLLAHFILRALVRATTVIDKRQTMSLPLILSAPKNVDAGTCIVVGIPPVRENSPKNFFGKAFEQAAEKINCEAKCDYFDSSYFEIHVKDRTRFFDALTGLLC